jgi:hypothetical protein
MYKRVWDLAGSVLLVLTLCAAAPGQAAAPVEDDGPDDILLLVKVTAREVTLNAERGIDVKFPGTFRRSTVWVTERHNLPERLEPGVTYRDVGIRLRISSRFENIEQIVREALGEVQIDPERPKTDAVAVVASKRSGPTSPITPRRKR